MTAGTKAIGCPLCDSDGGLLIFKNHQLRVIQAAEAGFPAFYRVIWNAHVPEFSDLRPDERIVCMSAVAAVEKTMLEQLQPTKVNLAALGNKVPHLHWHVVARFDWDSHFPGSVWGEPARPQNLAKLSGVAHKCAGVNSLMAEKLASV